MKTVEYWQNDPDGYLERNKTISLEALTVFFMDALKMMKDSASILEFGCNIGKNLRVLKQLYPNTEIIGYDINPKAIKIADERPGITAYVQNIIKPTKVKADLVFTKGVLIHQHPDTLEKIYENLYNASNKYLLVCEYYNPFPMEIEYRGKRALLWKRDFCGELLDKYSDLELIDYGFRYHRDQFPADDITWFLMKKES